MATRNLEFKTLSTWAVLGSLIVAVFASLAWLSPAPAQGKTVQNLQAAYLGEANAYVRYLAFAERAQSEEFGEAASLFRAAAYAEHLHMRNFARELRKVGYEPTLKIDTPVVKPTAENLTASADIGEAFERDTLYPEFIKEAKAEGNEGAAQVFQYAMTAEAQHAKLFKKALENLHRMNMTSHLYYVCNVCGYTTERATDPCPGCGNPKATYEEMF